MTKKNCDTCDSDSCSAKERRQNETVDAFLERQALARRMCQIGHKVLILSGKGGLRGYEAQRILDEKGFERVSYIEGGLVGWPFELRAGS